MATFTLDDLKTAAEKKYAPTVIQNGKDEYVLPNLLQVDSARRKKVLGLIEDLDKTEDMDEQLGVINEMLTILTEDGRGEELLALLGDNTALLMELFESWMEGAQVGEAGRS